MSDLRSHGLSVYVLTLRIHGQFKHHGAAAAICTCLSVHTIVEHPNQEGDTLQNLVALIGLTAESVYGGDIQSILTDH